MFQFSYIFAFINFSSLKLDTENNANFDSVSSKCANFDEVQFFKTYCTPKLTIFGTHNLQTFKHNTLVNELLLIQLYLFNIRCIIGSEINYASHCLSTEETCTRHFWYAVLETIT